MSDEADVTDPLGPPRLVRAEVRARLLIGTLSHSLLRRSLVVLCVAILCFLPGLFALPVTDRDEARFAQASKQMLETRDFVDIRFQDEPRYKKPVGIYWLQSASAAVLGVDHIAAFRVPSMLGATAASMVTAQIGTVLFGPAAGLLSGVVLASTLLVVGEANIAKTDAVLLFSATLVLLGAIQAWRGRTGVAPAAQFWGGLILGTLVKGPVIFLPASGLILWLLLWAKNRDWLRTLRPKAGFIAFLALVLPWYIAITLRHGGAFWEESIGVDLLPKLASGQESHGAPPGVHLLATTFTFWPWTILLAAALTTAVFRIRDKSVQLLLVWVLPTWLVFEIAPTKLPHYTLPVFPALAILAGAWLSRDGGARDGGIWIRVLGAALFGMATLLLTGLVTAGPLMAGGGLDLIATLFAGAMLALGAVAMVAFFGDHRAALTGVLILSTVCLSVALLERAVPRLKDYLISVRLAEALLETRCAGRPLALVGYHEPSSVFLMGQDIALINRDDLAGWQAAHPDGLAWIPEELAGIGTVEDGMNRVAGTNYNGGDPVALVLVDTGNAPVIGPCTSS